MGGHGEPQDSDDLAAVSCGFLRASHRNLSTFCVENCRPYIWHTTLKTMITSLRTITLRDRA